MKTCLKNILVAGVMIGTTATAPGATLQFDGSNDYVRAGTVNLANQSFTIEAWARRRSANTKDFIVSQGATSIHQGLHFGFHYAATLTNLFVFGFYNNDLITTNQYTDTDWHHWAGTYDAATKVRRIYRDGLLVATNLASANYQGTGSLVIGDVVWGGSAFHGEIDDVRIWSRARSQPEIQANLHRSLTGAEPGLLAYYPMEEGTGTTTADVSGHGYSGTLLNGPLWNPVEDAVAPVALTRPAAWVSGTSAQLQGGVNPNGATTTNYFECWSDSTTNMISRQLVSGTNSVLNLDGLDDYVVVPTNSWFSGEFTIETWIYARSFNNYARILDFGTGGLTNSVVLCYTEGTNGKPGLWIFDSAAANQWIVAPQPIALNQWVHIAATFKSGTASLFVNGVPVVSGSLPAPTPVARTRNRIGYGNHPNDLYSNVLLEDLRIWNVARTADQIRQFMAEPVSPSDPNLVVNYRFDEASGTAALDSRTASPQHGTLTNGAARLPSLPVSATLSNLIPGQVYYFRPVAESTNGTSFGSTGQFATLAPGGGTALKLDGTNNQYARVADLGPRIPSAEVTLEFWTKVNQKLDAPTPVALSPDQPANRFLVQLGRLDHRIFWDFGDINAGGRLYYDLPEDITGTWQHFAFVASQSGSFMRIFRNGVLVKAESHFNNFAPGDYDLVLGTSFNGNLDEFRIWNVARSEADILRDLNTRLSGNEPGLVTYFRMDEGAGGVLMDATTNGHDGLLVAGPVYVPSGASVGFPIAVTMGSSFAGSNRMALNGHVIRSSSADAAWFEYGTSTNYGQTTPATSLTNDVGALPVSMVMTVPGSGIAYHFRLAASNSVGISYGADQTFQLSVLGSLADSGLGSLRQTIANAPAGAVILLTNTGTITLTNGELTINQNLTIVGPGAANLAISGNRASRVFNLAGGTTVNISGLTIRDGLGANGPNGADGNPGAAGGPGASGGGIYNAGALTLSDCVFTNNRAGTGGTGGNGYGGDPGKAGGLGGAGGNGGAIYNHSTGMLTVNRCTLSGNSSGPGGLGGSGGRGSDGSYFYSGKHAGSAGAGGDGGAGAGIYNGGMAVLNLCTISANQDGAGGAGGTGGTAGAAGGAVGTHRGTDGLGGNGGAGGGGGGVCNANTITLLGCTIAFNSTGAGGALGTSPNASRNGAPGTAGSGGGINHQASAQPAQVANTIVALNTTPASVLDDVAGAFASLGHNLIGTPAGSSGFASAAGDLLNVPPLLGPLADNGGPTRTHALWPESLAVNAGDNALATFATDQRGSNRIACGTVDIGAYEEQICQPLHPSALTALYFDGVDDYVDLGPSAPLLGINFTQEAWICPRLTDQTWHGIVGGNGGDASKRSPSIYVYQQTKLHGGFGTGSQWISWDTTNVLQPNAWNHVAATYDGAVYRVYVNAQLVLATNLIGVPCSTRVSLIGAIPPYSFQGSLDEVRIWGVTRSAQEIREHYNRALTGAEIGLLAYYRFNEAGGTTAINSAAVTGLSLNGTLQNGPVYVPSGAGLYQPMVTTLPAATVLATRAVLRGSVNPAGTNETMAWFEYGQGPSFGQTTEPPTYIGTGLNWTNVSITISNLDPGTKYYFRLVAQNSAGVNFGSTMTFDTLVVGTGYPVSTRAESGQTTSDPRHIADADGNVILAGLFSQSATFNKTLYTQNAGTNAFLAKLSRKGDWLWAASIPVTTNLQIKSLALDPNHQILVAGVFSGTATFGPTNLVATSGSRAFLAKYNPAATNWSWAAAWGGGASNCANAVAVGADGAAFVAGTFGGTASLGITNLVASGPSDAFVIRFSPVGQPVWAVKAGGASNDVATALALGSSDLFVAGFYQTNATFGAITLTNVGGSDLFFARLNPTNGLFTLAVEAGGAGLDRATALAMGEDGPLMLAQFAGPAKYRGNSLPELDQGTNHVMVAQLNRDGALLRYAVAHGSPNNSLSVEALAVDALGQVYVAGDFTGLMQYDTTTVPTSGQSDGFVAQLTPNGDKLQWTWFERFGRLTRETCASVSADTGGSVVIAGTYEQFLTIGNVQLSTSNPQEIYLARMDANQAWVHNEWVIGEAVTIPALAQDPGRQNGGAYGYPRIQILDFPRIALPDTTAENSFFWNSTENKLYAIRPVTAVIKWPMTADVTNLARVAIAVGRSQWPAEVQRHVAGAPVEVQGPGVGLGFAYSALEFGTNGASVTPETRGTAQFQVFRTATNASGYTVVRYTQADGDSAFEVVLTRPLADWLTNATVPVGEALPDPTGNNGYVFHELAYYDGAGEQRAYDRATRAGPIIPVNVNSDPPLVVVWYHTNRLTGVAWGCDPVQYQAVWPATNLRLDIASGEGFGPLTSMAYPDALVYHQPNRNLAGFNPNDEHALLARGSLYALRCDLAMASEPYVLLKYRDARRQWKMDVIKVQAGSFTHYTGTAGSELQVPSPLDLLPLCTSSNRLVPGPGTNLAHQAWTGRFYAKAAGYLELQYWYPLLPEFYYDLNGDGTNDAPAGAFVPWLDRLPGGVIGEPVEAGYTVAWPTNVPSLQFGETLTTLKHELPDLLNFASARVIYDGGNPAGTNWAGSLARIFDPLSERTIQLDANGFKLPAAIATAKSGSRVVFPELPYAIRLRLFYDPPKKRLSFGGWYNPKFGAGEPLLLPNILSPRERDRIKQLDGTNTVSEFDEAIDQLYDLTRNPNQVDVDGQGGPDQELRVGLITQIRTGHQEILVGPVIPGLSTNRMTNILASPVTARVTNIIQEQFGNLPKALTAALRPASGYVTLIENDDPALPPGITIRLHVLRVETDLFQGDLKVLPSDFVFDERLTLRHSADFGGEPQKFEFEWYYQPDQAGVSPAFPTESSWNGWIPFPTPPPLTNNGYNDITIGEGGSLSSLLTLGDNWFICRYRGFFNGSPTAWSPWVGGPGGDRAMLAEGWIKRVMAGLNAFDSRVKDFHDAPAATYASMVLQAGERYEGPVAFNPDPNYLNQLGLIASYETVLERGRTLSIDGLPPVNFGPANNALLLAAGEIADLYMLLGNEAYADAEDPTIGFSTASGDYGNLAPSIFCFQNQLDSLLSEELALLRGRDDATMTVRANPFYNRLIWNFTRGEGEVAYSQHYNISDQNHDGFVDEQDARLLYPQGHGDAWGHYLTAIKKYYELLRHPNYEWIPRAEAVLVAGTPTPVDYLDERKFAQAAAARAKAGVEIVNLTYREKYVENPAGQWQGYKDAQADRAWGVDDWARRAGTGAYFDWVVANAILPATDPDPNHVGIQKIDRTTVAELFEIPSQFTALEAQMDAVDRGLNPLGLAAGVMPFDIDPSKIAAGQTHFDQVFQRAVDALENTLALFDHANNLSQNLRRNQDSVEAFTANVKDQERDFKNRLIEIFGYPYAGDIGPGKSYPSGYDGPDLAHYMYVAVAELSGKTAPPSTNFTAFFKTKDYGIKTTGNTQDAALGESNHQFFFPDDLQGNLGSRIEGDILAVPFPVSSGDYAFAAPAEWGLRRAPGELQSALSDLLQNQARLQQGLVKYANQIKDMEAACDMLEQRYGLRAREMQLRNRTTNWKIGLGSTLLAAKGIQTFCESRSKSLGKATDIVITGLPTTVGLSSDISAPIRAASRSIEYAVTTGFDIAAQVAAGVQEAAQKGIEIAESSAAWDLGSAQFEYDIQQKVKDLEKLMREEAPLRVEVFQLSEAVGQALGRYQAALAKGERLMEERFEYRKKMSARTTEYRYQDMAFRIFQNDALQKYRAQFDLAARYVYLTAKAYDYETCLLHTDTGAGSRLLTDIVRERTPGYIIRQGLELLPLPGRPGLADPLARLSQNFEVYRGQLGFTTPETETGRFSLRSELFRIRPGDLQTNALTGLASTNQNWKAVLQRCRVPDLWKVPEFRRFCRPFAPESAGPQPGLVIPIPTTVTFGLNYFGWPLGPGDSSYDSSRFATKVRSAGVWFTNYNIAGLSMTPRVYLVPAGTDILRSPSSADLEIRQFNIVDQKLPVPFPIGASALNNAAWIPINDTLSETFGDIRRFSSFRAYHDSGGFNPAEATQDTRLIGRSVWNTRWLLIIPGGTFLYDPDQGLDTFIDTVGDIKIFFQTYSYSGN